MRQKILCLSLFLWSSISFALNSATEMDCERHYCATIIDAGSSGSRIHWYQYDKDKQSHPIHIKEMYSKKVKPGLSAVQQDPDVIAKYMQTLMDNFSQPNVPVFLYATAGMRLLSDDSQEYYYAEIKKWFAEHPEWPLVEARTISGKEEGVFGWVSLNYYLHTLQTKYQPLAGLIEIGGASAQVVFPVQDTSHVNPEDVVALRIYGRNMQLYSHSFLGLGINEIFKHNQEQNACFSVGYPMRNEMVAKGDAQQCQVEIGKTLQQNYHVDTMTNSALQQNSTAQWYAVAAVSTMLSNFPFDFPNHEFTSTALLQQGNSLFCQQSYQSLLDNYTNNEFVHKNCLLSSYFSSLLTQGLGLNTEQIIHYSPEYDGSWTLGALLVSQTNVI